MMLRNLRPLLDCLAVIHTAGDLFGSDKPTNDLKPSDISGKIFTVVPNGCKQYWFGVLGVIIEFPSHMEGDRSYDEWKDLQPEVAFHCYAISEKSAIKKFNKWKGGKP